MGEQLSLFDMMLNETIESNSLPIPKEKKSIKKKEKAYVPHVPEEIVQRYQEIDTLKEMLLFLNITDPDICFTEDGRFYQRDRDYWRFPYKRLHSYHEELEVYCMYMDTTDGTPFVAKTIIDMYGSYNGLYCGTMYNSVKIRKGTFRHASRLENVMLIQSYDEVEKIFEKTMPYTYKFWEENGGEMVNFILAPELEHLIKAGFTFAERYTKKQDDYGPFNRLIKRSTSPGKIKNIFKAPVEMINTLKNETNMSIWEDYRIMMKFGRLSKSDVEAAYRKGFRKDQIRLVSLILMRQYDGKPVFTFQSLMHYLERIDMYEAIEMDRGLQTLNDYLSMCQTLGIRPKIDGDSLMREHDIASRLSYLQRDSKYEKGIIEAGKRLKTYDYAEDVFYVRGIRNRGDLLDEAKQQHNCVASYGRNIADGSSLIFTMREVKYPQKSLITIELSPTGEIRQKYLAYNRPINNKAQTDFINRWIKRVKGIMANKEVPFVLPEALDTDIVSEEIMVNKFTELHMHQNRDIDEDEELDI